MKKFEVSVLIISRNRKQKLTRCLKLLRNQIKSPNEVVLIEDISENQNFDEKSMLRILGSRIKCVYRAVKYANYAKSRNLALILANGDILLWIDDDVIFDRFFIESMVGMHKNNPEYVGIVPLIKPIIKNIYSEFMCWYAQYGLGKTNDKENIKIPYSTFTAISLRSDWLKKSRISFDSNTKTGEDIIFISKLVRACNSLYRVNRITVKHDFASDLWGFCKKHYVYARDFAYQQMVLNNGVTDGFYPTRKIQVIGLPFFIFYRSYVMTMVGYKECFWPSELKLLMFLMYIIHFVGVYFSKEGFIQLIKTSREIMLGD